MPYLARVCCVDATQPNPEVGGQIQAWVCALLPSAQTVVLIRQPSRDCIVCRSYSTAFPGSQMCGPGVDQLIRAYPSKDGDAELRD